MKKKRNLLLIVTIVLAIIVVIGGGYLVYDKVLKKDNLEKNENRNGEKEEQAVALATDSELVNTLFSYVNMNTHLFYENEEVTLEKLSSSLQYQMAWLELENKDITISCNMQETSMEDCYFFLYEVPEASLERALKKVLGEKATLNKEDHFKFDFRTKWKDNNLFIPPLEDSIYNENFVSFYNTTSIYMVEDEAFIGEYATHEGPYTPFGDFSKIESASKKGKTITIVEKAFFVDLHPKTSTAIGTPKPTEYIIYSDSKYTKPIGTVSIEEFDKLCRTGTSKEIEAFTEKYIKEAMTVTYTFEENGDGSYHFVSSRITN